MRSIAVIQNDSEMLRYSWADIAPMVESLPYVKSYFTFTNIDSFWRNIRSFHSVIIASNAFNNRKLLESFRDHSGKFIEYLESGTGLFVSLQMKMPSYDSFGFLPSKYAIRSISRLKGGERPQDGKISVLDEMESHPILRYPNVVNDSDISYRCLNNTCAVGYYWAYLERRDDSSLQPVLVDPSYRRELLCISSPTERSRVIVTSLAADWQRQTELYENSIRYVTEGYPRVGLVHSHLGQSPHDRYLISSLGSDSVSSKTYVPSADISSVHDVVILSDSLNDEEKSTLNSTMSMSVAHQNLTIVDVESGEGQNLSYRLTTSTDGFENEIRQAATWLTSQYSLDDSHFWVSSFWYTLDSIEALVATGYPVIGFREGIFQELETHNIDGSYDEVLGATCAKLRLMDLLGNIPSKRLDRSCTWILNNTARKDPYELAAAVQTLLKFAPKRLPSELKNNLLSYIKERHYDDKNDYQLARYLSVAHALGETGLVRRLTGELLANQGSDGSWGSVVQTGGIVNTLADVHSALTPSELEQVRLAVAAADVFVRSAFDSHTGSWGGDVAATSKGILSVVAARELGLEVPSTGLKFVQSALAQSTGLYSIASHGAYVKFLGGRLKELVLQNAKLADSLRREETSLSRIRAFGFVSSLLILILSCAISVFTIALARQDGVLNKMLEISRSIVSDEVEIAVIPIVAFIFILWILVAKWAGVLPKWARTTLNAFLTLIGRGEKVKLKDIQ